MLLAGVASLTVVTAALVDAAGPEHANVAGSVLNANRQIGSLGIAVMGVILNSIIDWDHGAAVSFLAVDVAYLLDGLGAWQLIARPARRSTATAAA